MSALTGARLPATRLVERLLDALGDPARRERNAAVVLIAYVALWTLYAAIAKGSQDIHADMSEQFVLARELAFGYPKHPPLTMLVVRAWFAVFPAADWAYYLLAMANAALALWISWRLSARFLTGDKRVLGLTLLTLIPFFNFHALKFNSNTVLMPLWAGTTLYFLRSFETRSVRDAALAGLWAAAAMYGKYWSVVLLLGLATAALVHPGRADYFRSRAPWITMIVGGIAIAPHLIWLIANGFAPFSYAVAVHGQASVGSALADSVDYLVGSIAYVCVPLLVVFAVARPTGKALADMAWPGAAERRLAAAAFWATLVLPALVAPLLAVRLTSLWSMSGWTLLPVMLLSSPLISVGRSEAVRIVTVALGFPLAMLALSPAIGFVMHEVRSGSEVHSSLLAGPVERLWRDTTDAPLQLFSSAGVLVDGVPFYLHDHPISVHVLERAATAQEDARIAKEGVALLCPMSAPSCLAAADARAKRSSLSKRREVEVSRRYLGIAATAARYLIVAIPPAASGLTFMDR